MGASSFNAEEGAKKKKLRIWAEKKPESDTGYVINMQLCRTRSNPGRKGVNLNDFLKVEICIARRGSLQEK